MSDSFKHLSSDKQVAFFLGLSETLLDFLSTSSGFKEAKNAIKVCWEWLENKQKSGDDIYYLLDDGTEFSGLFIQMQMDEGELHEAFWNCIVDAVSYTDWKAYLYKREKYLPSPIENVDDNLVRHFLDNFYIIKSSNKKLAEKFILYLNKTESVGKNSITNFINANR